MNRLSQAPLGSNPQTAEALGLNNVPLNQQQNGITKDNLKDFLNRMIRYGNDNNQRITLQSELQEILTKIANPENEWMKTDLVKIGNALDMANDGKKATRDPDTNQKDPDAIELSKRLLKKIEANFRGATKVYNNKIAQTKLEKKKKKTRGNPFRVLMGKVGKLLDHGVEKRDIVRYLAKLKYWNNETIERAVDIVKDYNRKRERKEDENDEKTAESATRIITSALDYERKPEFHKRSTPELILRACFLMDLMEVDKNTKQGDFKDPADKKGAKEELKSIRQALTERGFDKDELSNLGLGE